MIDAEDEKHLARAVALSRERMEAGLGGPFGALIVRGGETLAEGWNEVTSANDPTAHAEVLVLRDAAAAVGSWRLDDCTLVVTLEPCVMCAGAALSARIGTLVFGAADPKGGATGSLYSVVSDPRLNHNPPTVHGVLAEECADLLTDFFAGKRA